MSASKKLQIPEKLRPVVGASIFFFIMIVSFMITSPGVFLDFGIYTAVFLSLPLFTIVGLGLVYITVAGEIDLSFPSIIALSGLAFAWTLEQTQLNFGIAAIAALVVGTACGYINGLLVTKLGLSSLITTLGMNFALIGLTNILNRGEVRMLSEHRLRCSRRWLAELMHPAFLSIFRRKRYLLQHFEHLLHELCYRSAPST